MKQFLLFILPTLITAQLEWQELSPDYPDPSIPSPSPRRDAGLGWDQARGRVIVFGGRTYVGEAEVVLADTWSFDLETSKSLFRNIYITCMVCVFFYHLILCTPLFYHLEILYTAFNMNL